jgi:NAD(P)-dependent dehydrogenase (short-subunit alcohol dehydrogenase family)
MKRGASIINSSSVVAVKGSFAMIDYSAGKAGILGFTKSLAGQQAPNGIRVNAVCPGPVYTPLQPASRTPEQMHNWGLGEIPLRGRVAQPAEMGGVYVFLAAPESNYVTGATMHCNGGQRFD